MNLNEWVNIYITEISEDHSSDPNDKYVVRPCKNPKEPWAVWEGEVRVKGFATKEEAQAFADMKNKEQGLGESKVNEEAELPAAQIPSAIKAKLAQAIDKIKDTNLTYNQKLQVIGKVIDSLGVDKKELAKMSSKLKTTLESLNEEDPCWDDYEMVGMKKKNGKEVPNCVPKKESVNEGDVKKINKAMSDKEREEWINRWKKLKPSAKRDMVIKLWGGNIKEATPEEEDEFHTKLDKLVHKTFGHSSDEEKMNEATPDQVIKDLDKAKNDLLKKVNVLIAKKKKLYSNVDIESPMSADEKKLNNDIADLFSQINKLVLQKRSIKKESTNESKIKMNALDWGKSTAERNANLDKYDSLKSDKEREAFLRKLKGESVNEGIWPKSKLADRFEFILSDELKKNFKGLFYVDGYDLYHNDKKVMTINPDKDSANSIVKTLKSKIKESVSEGDDGVVTEAKLSFSDLKKGQVLLNKFRSGRKYTILNVNPKFAEVKNLKTGNVIQIYSLNNYELKESVNEGTEPDIITQLRDVVENGYNTLKDPKTGKKMKVDTYSASAVTQVYDALKQQSNKDKFVSNGLVGMVNLAFKILNKQEIVEYDVETLEELNDFHQFMKEYKSDINEAEYQGREVKLGKIMQGDVKKFKVYVKNDKGNVVKVNFGQKGMNIKKDNPEARKSFRARMNCDNPGPRWKARYWSCRKW